MAKPHNTDSKDYRDWIDSALNDFLATASLIDSELYEQVCAFSYQSVEKTMKAFLFYIQGYAPETHDLEYLYKICLKYYSKFTQFSHIPGKFKNYYYDVRYPSYNAPYIDDDVAEDLMYNAGQFFNSIEDIIEQLDEQKIIENRKKYGKYKGYNLWDIAVDWYIWHGSKRFHQEYGFYWSPTNDKLIKEAKEHIWIKHRIFVG